MDSLYHAFHYMPPDIQAVPCPVRPRRLPPSTLSHDWARSVLLRGDDGVARRRQLRKPSKRLKVNDEQILDDGSSGLGDELASGLGGSTWGEGGWGGGERERGGWR